MCFCYMKLLNVFFCPSVFCGQDGGEDRHQEVRGRQVTGVHVTGGWYHGQRTSVKHRGDKGLGACGVRGHVAGEQAEGGREVTGGTG